MNLVDDFLFFLVLIPGVTLLPANDFCHFLRPIGECPSHHPCGWSTGFMFFPSICGFFPSRLCLPAFPMTTCWCWSFPISQMVARQFSLNFLTSPEDNLMNTILSRLSLPTMLAYDHAVFMSFPEENGVTSRLNIFTHSGISLSCFLFPWTIGAWSQQMTVSPVLMVFHASTYLFSPSAKLSNAILDVL